MLEIDGSKGGGQILRSALSLSAVKQKDFAIRDIRGERPQPGLKPQHISCVKAIQRLTDADVVGLEKGSKELEFKPQGLESQNFTVNIGTAGSVNLIVDTLIPLAPVLEGFRVNLKGGTDVKWSLTSLNQEHVKIKMLEQQGLQIDYDLRKTGYYPKGRGEVRFESEKAQLSRLEVNERGSFQSVRIDSKASNSLKDQSVADRQAKKLEKLLKKNLSPSLEVEKNIFYEETDSIGSALNMTCNYVDTVAGFDELGEKGKRSEKVAENLYKRFREFNSSKAIFNSKLGDQLMVLAGLHGWSYTVPKLTNHIESNQRIINRFLEDKLVVEDLGDVFRIKGKK